MLGNVIRDQSRPQQVEISTMLLSALSASMVENRDSIFTTNSPVGMARELKFRMSGIGTLCPRMYALAVANPSLALLDGEVIDSELSWIFGTGTAIHHQFQNAYLNTLGDVFQGWWRCNKCGCVHKGERMPDDSMLVHKWIPKPSLCAGCADRGEELSHNDFSYVELEFESKEYRITGHCDGILDWRCYKKSPRDLVEVAELKTINDFGFKAVDPMIGGVPKPEHVLQCNAYMWALEGTEVTQARLIYIGKDFTRKMSESIVEHRVPRNKGYIEGLKRMLKDSVSSSERVAEWCMLPADERPEPDMPPRLRICTKRSDKRVKYCPAKAPCFPRKK